MIQANELRIGNLIYINNGEKPQYEYEVGAHDIEEIEGGGEDCFPIPLSPKWLERCGLAKFKTTGFGEIVITLFMDSELMEIVSQLHLTKEVKSIANILLVKMINILGLGTPLLPSTNSKTCTTPLPARS